MGSPLSIKSDGASWAAVATDDLQRCEEKEGILRKRIGIAQEFDPYHVSGTKQPVGGGGILWIDTT